MASCYVKNEIPKLIRSQEPLKAIGYLFLSLPLLLLYPAVMLIDVIIFIVLAPLLLPLMACVQLYENKQYKKDYEGIVDDARICKHSFTNINEISEGLAARKYAIKIEDSNLKIVYSSLYKKEHPNAKSLSQVVETISLNYMVDNDEYLKKIANVFSIPMSLLIPLKDHHNPPLNTLNP